MQQRRGIHRFGGNELRQFAALHGIETDRLQGLQCGAQHVLLRPLHAARDQADTAVFGAQYLDQQAGFAPGARMQDEGGFGGITHAAYCRSGVSRDPHLQSRLTPLLREGDVQSW